MEKWTDDEDDLRFEDSFENPPFLMTQDVHKRRPAAELFVLTVCLTRDVMVIRSGALGHAQPGVHDARSKRFFALVTRLPGNLQDRVARIVFEATGGFFSKDEFDKALVVTDEPQSPFF